MTIDAPTAGALAERFGLTLRGDATRPVHGVATLARANAQQLAFLANPRYRSQLAESQAGVVVMRAEDAEGYDGTALIAKDPYAAFAKIGALFDHRPPVAVGVHPMAVVDPTAVIDPQASIGPFTTIGPRTRVDAGAVVGPGCVVGEDCVVGAGCELVARVTLVRRVRLGRRVLVHPGAVLGADGFGIAMDAGHWLKVPQLGGVVVGDDCEIGANTTIDRGALDDTVLEDDVRLDNQIQIGHNVRIGAHTAIAGSAAIAGSVTIGKRCMIAGGVGIAGHLHIVDDVVVTARTLVTHSIDRKGVYSGSLGFDEQRAWRRKVARFRRLDDRGRGKMGDDGGED